MAKVTNEQRVKYQEHIAFYKKKLEELEKEIKTLKHPINFLPKNTCNLI